MVAVRVKGRLSTAMLTFVTVYEIIDHVRARSIAKIEQTSVLYCSVCRGTETATVKWYCSLL